jgi:hypothetical protein
VPAQRQNDVGHLSVIHHLDPLHPQIPDNFSTNSRQKTSEIPQEFLGEFSIVHLSISRSFTYDSTIVYPLSPVSLLPDLPFSCGLKTVGIVSSSSPQRTARPISLYWDNPFAAIGKQEVVRHFVSFPTDVGTTYLLVQGDTPWRTPDGNMVMSWWRHERGMTET